MKVNPVSRFASAQLPFTTFRPNLPAYVQVSNVIQQLTEAISTAQSPRARRLRATPAR